MAVAGVAVETQSWRAGCERSRSDGKRTAYVSGVEVSWLSRVPTVNHAGHNNYRSKTEQTTAPPKPLVHESGWKGRDVPFVALSTIR
jgi:hypothetical protein